MSLTERTQQLTPQEEHRLKRENANLRHQLKEAMERHDRSLKADSLFERATQSDVLMPEWSVRKQSSKKHQIIPVHLLSDFHFDEVVELSQTNGKNEYNRKIAERRLKRNFMKVGEVCRDYVKGFHYPGIVVAMLGDNFSGNIHEELKCTNEDTILGSLYHWLEPMGAGLKMLADEFGKVTVVSVVGNHGRNSIKPISKNRVRDNFDWLFSALLKRQFDQAGDKRFTWIIAEGHKQPFSVFDTKFLASHGDEAHGGSGIASLLSPLMIQAAKLKRLHDYDYWLIGHWHQLAAFKNVRVNGAGKGFDEYATIKSFEYQVPQQDLFFVSPEHGITASWPIFLEDK